MGIERVVPRGRWHALEDGEVVGRAYALHRPDGRTFVAVDAWRAETGAALLAVVIDELPSALFATVGEDDVEQLDLLQGAGFAEVRREDELVIPVGTALAATAPGDPPAGITASADPLAVTAPANSPAGITLLPADEVDAAALNRLDAELRRDASGGEGWVVDVDAFRAYTFDERHFDRETYLVAVDDTGELAGLIRVWAQGRVPRLGLLGVRRAYRRRGLARALVQAAFRPLAARGVAEVSAEVGADDTVVRMLAARLGARRTGGTIELRRPV